MNHVVCCCLMTCHTEAMATFASLNASVLALKPWKCYKEIVEFGGWKDSGRSWKTMKNLYKYISQRYRYASKIRSPKIQLVSYENSSISTSEKGHLTRRTITYPYYYAIHIYIYCLSTCWRCIVSSNHICQRSQPQPIAESEFLMVFGSTRPGTVLRGDLQLLKIGPPIPVKGEGLQGEWLFGWCHGVKCQGDIFPGCEKTKRKGYHQDHEVPIRNYLFRWEGTDCKGVRSKNPQSWNWEELGILPRLNWWNMVKW